MFAVIRTGGKQYKVVQDDVVAVEKLSADEGADVTFDDVLMVGDKVGSAASGASVTGKVLRQYKDDKVIVFKKKRRHNYRRNKGHRQNLTLVQITGIAGA